MKPSFNVLTQDAQQVTLDLFLPKDLFWFRGHFPVQPILPGVAQLEWAMLFARDYLNASIQLKSIKAIKFQMPLLPEDNVRLSIKLNQEKQLVEFAYQREKNNEWQPISNGKISVCL